MRLKEDVTSYKEALARSAVSGTPLIGAHAKAELRRIGSQAWCFGVPCLDDSHGATCLNFVDPPTNNLVVSQQCSFIPS